MGRQLSQRSRTEPIFIGFAGRTGTGKTSAAKYVSSTYGFQYARYSLVLREWLSAGEADSDQLRRLGWDLMSGGRQAELNSRLLATVDPLRSAVVDGLRHPVDFDSLASAFAPRFRLIFLEVEEHLRFERLRSRFPDFSAFQAAQSHPIESYIDGLKELADVTISNNGSITSLYHRSDIAIEAWDAGDPQ